jgi:hypothetical protein
VGPLLGKGRCVGTEKTPKEKITDKIILLKRHLISIFRYKENGKYASLILCQGSVS